MEKIIISEEVEDFFHDLIDVLYKEEYFGFKESSKEYINKIIDFIYNDLTNSRHNLTPKALLKYGPYYTKYSAGKRTAWYVFFDKKGDRFFIEYITNNHVAKAAFLKGLN